MALIRYLKCCMVIIWLSVFTLPITAVYADASWYSAAWSYRKSVTVTNAVAGYPTKIFIGKTSSAIGEDVDCGGKVKDNFGDLRFTSSNGTSLLAYWIESIADSGGTKIATVWVKNDAIPSTTCYMYYGNNSATTTSNGNATFPFFDDFLGVSVDAAKWTTVLGSPVVANSIVTLSDAVGTYCYLFSDDTYGQNYAQRARWKNKHNGTTIEYSENLGLQGTDNNGACIQPAFDEAANYVSYAVSGEGYDNTNDGNFRVAQTFTTDRSFTVHHMILPVYKVGAPGIVTTSIYATTSGKPSGIALCSGTINGDLLTGSPIATDMNCGGALLSANTQYAIVVQSAATGLYWQLNLVGTYSDGSLVESDNAGMTWTILTDYDCGFEVWGCAPHYYQQKALVNKSRANMVGWSIGTYHVTDIIRNSNASVIYKVDDANSVTISTNVPDESVPNQLLTRFYGGAEAAEISVDWVLVRPYTAIEPTWGIWGIEQEKPSSSFIQNETDRLIAQLIPLFMILGFIGYTIARIKIASSDGNMGFVIVEIVAEGIVVIIGAVLVANMLV